MAGNLPNVKQGDELSAKAWNRIVEYINRLMHIRSDGTIRVIQNSAGVLLSACIPPQSFFFRLTQDTPKDQGYVTAKRLRWIDFSQSYQTLDQDDEIKIYDRVFGLAFDGITDNDNRAPSQWTKTGFVGRAFWAADRGQWQIAEIEHVARYINFQLTAALASGDAIADGSLVNYWGGLDPTAGSGKINLLTAPTQNYKADDGAKGAAVWRNDLDNSQEWQYQITDIQVTC